MSRDKTGFWLQLRLLLWKNYTLKKRHPFVFLLEVFIPLTLFIIFLLIRKTQHAAPINTRHYSPMPLPSAGVVPMLQAFCNQKEGDDVYSANNTRLSSFLEHVQTFLAQTDTVLSQPEALQRLAPFVNQSITEWNAFQASLSDIPNIPILDIIKDIDGVRNLLQTKYNLKPPDIDTLLQSSLDVSQIVHSLPGVIHSLFDKGDLSVIAIGASVLFSDKSAHGIFKEMLSPPVIAQLQGLMCAQGWSNVIIHGNDRDSTVDGIFESLICQIGQNIDINSINDVQRFLDHDYILSKLKRKLPEQKVQIDSPGSSIPVDASGVAKMANSLVTLWGVVGAFPTGACCAQESSPRPGQSCHTESQNSSEKGHRTLEEKYAGLVKYVRLLRPSLCNEKIEDDATENNSTANEKEDDANYFTAAEKKSFRLLAKMLYDSPKILYAPNNTAANRIIQKVNATFAFYGNISLYAKQWLNATSLARTVLQPSISNTFPSALSTVFNKLLDDLDNIACSWLSLTSGIDFDVMRGFPSEEELEYYFLNKQYQDNVTVLAGLVFENLNDSTPELPPHVRYKIRQNATLNPPTSQVRNPLYFPSPGSDHLKYYKFGFVWIQDVVERAVIDLQAGYDVTEPGSYLYRMPYPCWLFDGFVWLIKHDLPLSIMLSWIYFVAMLVQRIVYEKEKGLKEVMKMMGLSNAVHWCAWFITAFLQMTLTVIILTLMLSYGLILPHSNPVIVFLFLEIFAVSTIALSFLISSVYSKAKLAAACAGILYMVTYVPYIYVAVKEIIPNATISNAVYKWVCILSTSACGIGGRYFLYYEMDGVGVQWSNIGESPRENDESSLQFIFFMMIVDTCIYFFLAWYIENVHPGTYGLPKPWYFPVLPAYWLSGSSDDSGHYCSLKQLFGIHDKASRLVDLRDDDDADDDVLLRPDDIQHAEREDEDLTIGVKVHNLTKVYTKNGKPAVNKLSMTLYEDQITSFLGHNGAGKTTTMSLLTGLFPPTSGDAIVNGSSIRTDMDTIRQSLGICPQHNVLFDSLTVEEHLWFYARLKGMKAKDITKETSRLLTDLGIAKKRSVLPSFLSGGMQRKLLVAMAFVGGAKTVILDEPTAGVDPYSRRSIWNLLSKYKKGRTILLSTHHMDEAEVLGDRIAIISNGELKCCGSPTYLKTLMGNGQHIHIVKGDTIPPESSQFNMDTRLLHLVSAIVPGTTISSSTASELHLLVPVSGSDKIKMGDISDMLRDNSADLGIQSYGVTDTGLEDVFVKITEDAAKDELTEEDLPATYDDRYRAVPDYDANDVCLDDLTEVHTPVGDEEDCQLINIEQTGSRRRDISFKHLRHFCALLTKRFRYALRNRKGIISQIILPAIFVSISMTIALSAPKQTDPPPITMSPSQYFNYTQPRGNFIPYSYKRVARESSNMTSDDEGDIPFDDKGMTAKKDKGRGADADAVVNTFNMPSGVGATCILKTPFNSEYDMDMIKHLNPKARHFELFEKYFNKNCSGVFTPGVKDQTFVPSVSILNVTLDNRKSNKTTVRYYPECWCIRDSRGFSCAEGDQPEPPSRHLVTRDILQDISATDDEEAFYLNTINQYRLHRYGGFSFGKTLAYVPDDWGRGVQVLPTVQRLAAKAVSQVRFNQKGYHSMPTYLNTLNNAILRANIPTSKGNPAAYGITLINHPMKETNNVLDIDYIQGGNDVLMAIFIIVAMAFVPASFVVFLVHERSIKAKHLQFISGVHPVVYWVTNYIWDMCNYMIPAVCIVAILLIFNIPAYTAGQNFQAVVSLFLLYGWSITPMMYPASFLFRESSVAYILLIVFNLFTGITCVVCSFMLEQFSFDEELNAVNGVLKKAFLIFPNYCLGNGLMDIALNQYMNEYYSHTGYYDKVRSPLEWDITGRRLVVMAISGLVFFVITILCEYRFFIRRRKHRVTNQSQSEIDDDVETERERTLNGNGQHDLLRLENLKKVYKTRKRGKIAAVDGLTFSVPRGECFGLLGVNGAGKTTTFKMLTGDIEPTAGDATLGSFSIRTDLGSVQRQIGYCPQFDALFTELTPREHLQLYARLRGVAPREERQVVKRALERLSLQKYARQPAGTLSGGNKRKLSTAISLIGNPSLIFMDEPTTGMDPYSRRFLWDTIKNVVKDGTSVLFTSHSMEECEYLCSRLSIMVNGQLKCIGCKQHLKNKFGDGYTLTLMTSDHVMNDVIEQVTSVIPDCIHAGRSHRTLLFEVKVDYTKLGDIYRTLADVCRMYNIKDYSLSQNTLDNVFVKFARHQKSSETDVEEDNDEFIDVNNDLDEDDSLITAFNNMIEGEDEPLLEMSPGLSRMEELC